MQSIRIILTGALALALSGMSIACCFVFGTHLAPGREGELYGILGGVADALKAFLPLAIGGALAASQKGRALAGAAMFLVFSAYSFTSELGLYALSREAVASDVQAGKEGYEAAKAERARIASRLKELGPQRPTGAVTADIVAVKQNLHWERSGQCGRPSWSAERTFCGGYEKLQGELASAGEADRLRGQDEKAAVKLSGFGLAAVMRSSDPQSEALGRFTGFSAQSVRDALAVLVAALIELGSGLGLWVAAGGARHGERKEESCALTAKAAPVEPPVAPHVEAVGQPASPRPRRKRTAKPRKALGVGAKVIQFRKAGPAIDPVKAFLETCCAERSGSEAKAADLHRAFRAWAESKDHPALSPKAFGSRLADLGFGRQKRGGVVRYSGLALRAA
jgi:hypothetical protein